MLALLGRNSTEVSVNAKRPETHGHTRAEQAMFHACDAWCDQGGNWTVFILLRNSMLIEISHEIRSKTNTNLILKWQA
ncbi:hypothetical protein [Diaphorobacter sp.]|uniref:hypothetical protein n=1 Tax=Diaphorobacter sp. TaxID=1934310 RepID=UPI0028A7C33E|nr:hypothetical protein [Diaphorobacter sp.]